MQPNNMQGVITPGYGYFYPVNELHAVQFSSGSRLRQTREIVMVG